MRDSDYKGMLEHLIPLIYKDYEKLANKIM